MKLTPKNTLQLKQFINNDFIRLGDIDTQYITSFENLFENCTRVDFTGIDTWNTSKVTSMKGCFKDLTTFNEDISKWDTSNVTDMDSMFENADSFNQNINNWNTAKVTTMRNTFKNATNFNQPLSNWNTSSVTNMDSLFEIGNRVIKPKIDKKYIGVEVYDYPIPHKMLDLSKVPNGTLDLYNNLFYFKEFDEANSFILHDDPQNIQNGAQLIHTNGSTIISNFNDVEFPINDPQAKLTYFWVSTKADVTDKTTQFISCELINQNSKPTLRFRIKKAQGVTGDIDEYIPLTDIEPFKLIVTFELINNGTHIQPTIYMRKNNGTIFVHKTATTDYFSSNTVYCAYPPSNNMFAGLREFIFHNKWLAGEYEAGGVFLKSDYPIVYQKTQSNYFVRDNTGYAFYRDNFFIKEVREIIINTSVVGNNANAGDTVTLTMVKPDPAKLQNLNITTNDPSRFYIVQKSPNTWDLIDIGVATIDCKVTFSALNAEDTIVNIQFVKTHIKYRPKNLQELKQLVNDLSINLGEIDTVLVNSFENLFENCPRQDFSGIGSWNTSNVTNMDGTFKDLPNFNENIGSWDTSKVTSMNGTFENATSFDQDINHWDVSNVTSNTNFNKNCPLTNEHNPFIYVARDNASLRKLVENLNIKLGSIDTSLVTDFSRVFEDTPGYELHRTDYTGCETWVTAQVTTLASLCKGNKKFNHNINSWNTSNVTTMNSTFMGATNFNQPLNNWDTSKVTNMDSMFEI